MNHHERIEVDCAGQRFSFDLNSQQQHLTGETPLYQWWMPVTPLYGQRRGGSSLAHNHREILRLYWSEVKRLNAEDCRDAQERFLLASMVSEVRVAGSRSIFADAFLKSARPDEIRKLDTLIRQGSTTGISREEFHNRSLNLLGRREYPDGLQATYDEFLDGLLKCDLNRIDAENFDDERPTVIDAWKLAMKRIGRRARRYTEKLVMDVLSYESRAAFHDCYSVAWCYLIPRLAEEQNWNLRTCWFHQFWHTGNRDHVHQTPLFHGHVFGLHPASGPFMKSSSGRELLGNWLCQPSSEEDLGRLLHGLLIALFDYQSRRDDQAKSRARPEVGVSDLVSVEETREEQRRGRRARRGRA